MAKDTLNDDDVIRLWTAVMEQVAKDYIDLYISYLKKGPDCDVLLANKRKYQKVRTALIDLEDYILGDYIAGPYATYIVQGLRREAEEHVKEGRKRRKEIFREYDKA